MTMAMVKMGDDTIAKQKRKRPKACKMTWVIPKPVTKKWRTLGAF